jgi:hypothetical protein
LNEEHKEYIRELLHENSRMTLYDIQSHLSVIALTDVSITAIHNAIIGFHYSLKVMTVQVVAANTPELQLARREYSLQYTAQVMAERNLVFVDEIGFTLSQRVNYGRSLIGTPARITVPFIRSRNVSVMAAMTRHG